MKWAEAAPLVIETVEQAQNYSAQGKIGIVAQTTFSGKAFQDIVSALIMKATEIKIERTILYGYGSKTRFGYFFG